MRMFAILLSAFFSINMLLILLAIGSTVYTTEERAQQVLESFKESNVFSDNAEQTELTISGFTLQPIDIIPDDGFHLPHGIQKHLPINDTEALRGIAAFDTAKYEIRFKEWVQQITYYIYVNIEDSTYKIHYQIGNDLYRLLILSIIILVAELLLLLKGLIKGSLSIRKVLRPISEMAETAMSLNAQVTSMNNTDYGSIQNLAGAISTIDASHLDQRISIDESQHELKELAQAINLMLNRISASYQSQVRFVSDASHELRTPISVIQGYVNLLDRWGKNDEKTLQESIDAIKSETENMKRLVEHLLFLARGDNESMQLHLVPFDICDLVEEIIREAQMIDISHRFEVQLARPVTIVADRQLIKQSIRILLDNSIKYTPANETITLKVNKDHQQVKVTVQDHGIGISPEDLPHIFDRFYRSDESRARKTGGSGLGLSIAKWIVERHGGHFEVLSRLDIGTRTSIILPT